MNARSALVVLAALSALAGLAVVPSTSAQVPTQAPASLTLTVLPFEGPVAAGEPATTGARVDYCYFVAGSVALASTIVRLTVVDAPEWATVHVSPPAVSFPISPQAHSTTVCAPSQQIVVTLVASRAAPPGAVATVRVGAFAEPNFPIAGTYAEDGTIVVASAEPCHHDATAGVAEPEAGSPDGEGATGDVTTASFGGAPVAVAPASALLGLAGVGAGAAYAMKRRRAP